MPLLPPCRGGRRLVRHKFRLPTLTRNPVSLTSSYDFGNYPSQPKLDTLCGMGTAARRWPRYDVSAPVRVLAETGSGVASVVGCGTQLNEGGMTLFAAIPLMMGERVVVELTPAQADEPIRVPCYVRNRHCYTYGLEFTSEVDTNVGRLRAILPEDYRGAAPASA